MAQSGDTRFKEAIRRSLQMGVIGILLAAAGCGNSNKEYKETFSAEAWTANLESEGYQVPAEPDESAAMVESSAPQPDEIDEDSVQQFPEDVSTDSMQVAAGDSVVNPVPARRRVAGNWRGNPAEVFNDSNHYQLEHARRLGIEPISDLRSYFHPRRPLIKVVTNDDFKVDYLTHSYPYLVPEADALLHDIGHNFRETVKRRGGSDYRIIVTSLLRTPVTVKKLRRVNTNATEQSTHQYATTFDIVYTRFDPVGGQDNVNYADLKMILAEVLEDLRSQGRCMVKYERKTPCFHITVTK